MSIAGLLKPFAKIALTLIAFSFLFASCSKHNCPAYGNQGKKSFKKYRADVEVMAHQQENA